MRQLFCGFFVVLIGACPVMAANVPDKLQKAIKEKLGASLKDPYSAQYTFDNIGNGVVCGTINAKNSYGAFVGRKPFTAMFSKDTNSFKVHFAEQWDSVAEMPKICR